MRVFACAGGQVVILKTAGEVIHFVVQIYQCWISVPAVRLLCDVLAGKFVT